MINLSQIFKSDPQVPMVAAVLVNKAADMDVAKARIKKAGFQTDTFDDSNDGVVIFPQAETVGDVTPGKDGAYLVKMDEMLSCILTGVTKSFESINFDSTSFDEVMAQEGMRPGVHLSMDILGATVSNIFAKAEDRAEMVTDLSKALDEFKAHIVDMAQAVPETAFSMDFFKAEDFVVKTEADAEADADGDAGSAGEAEADASADAAASEDPSPAQAAGEADPGEADDAEAPGLGAVMGQMADLAKGIAGLTSLAKATDAKVVSQGKKLDDTAALAKSASDAVSKISNTVQGGAEADPNPEQLSKSEQEAFDRANPPLLDTAMSPLN